MAQVKQIQGSAIPLRGDDIDTDRIIPARFLRCVTFDGLGEHVFMDDRAQAVEPHPFDQPQYQGATLLLVNRNFGCGSSREHAPQAIARWGIQGIIGVSFAEIFFGNCLAMGLPCVTATAEAVRSLQAAVEENPQQQLSLDLKQLTITYDGGSLPVVLADGPHQMLLTGSWDACGQLVAQADAIRAIAAKLPYLSWSTLRS